MNRLNLWRGAAILACVLASTAIAVTSAGAKPKPFTPKPGTYAGEFKSSEQSTTFEEVEVVKKGKVYVVELNASWSAVGCEVEGQVYHDYDLTISSPAAVTGKTFKASTSVANTVFGHPEAGSSKVQVKINGHFTSPTSFTGTTSATTSVEAGNAESRNCATGPISFSLKKQ
jgi:hypothetical protein